MRDNQLAFWTAQEHENAVRRSWWRGFALGCIITFVSLAVIGLFI